MQVVIRGEAADTREVARGTVGMHGENRTRSGCHEVSRSAHVNSERGVDGNELRDAACSGYRSRRRHEAKDRDEHLEPGLFIKRGECDLQRGCTRVDR